MLCPLLLSLPSRALALPPPFYSRNPIVTGLLRGGADTSQKQKQKHSSWHVSRPRSPMPSLTHARPRSPMPSLTHAARTERVHCRRKDRSYLPGLRVCVVCVVCVCLCMCVLVCACVCVCACDFVRAVPVSHMFCTMACVCKQVPVCKFPCDVSGVRNHLPDRTRTLRGLGQVAHRPQPGHHLQQSVPPPYALRPEPRMRLVTHTLAQKHPFCVFKMAPTIMA